MVRLWSPRGDKGSVDLGLRSLVLRCCQWVTDCVELIWPRKAFMATTHDYAIFALDADGFVTSYSNEVVRDWG